MVAVRPSPPAHSPADRQTRLLALIEQLRVELHPGAAGPVALASSLEEDLGLDSLARGELLLRIEAAFTVRLPEGTLGRAETPRDLLQALEHSLAAPSPLRSQSSPPNHTETPSESAPAGEILLPTTATTLVQVLEWQTSHLPAREHVHFLTSSAPGGCESLTYLALLASARQLAGGLAALGLAPGQAVAIMLPTSLAFFQVFFATQLAGGVPVPLYPPANPARLADHLRRQAGILESCQAPLLVTVPEARALARLVQAKVGTLKRVISPAEVATLGARQPLSPQPAAAPGDLALLQYTSGSTGNPKGVMLSHANLLANIRAWSRATRLTPDDVCVSWLPLYHDMGLIGAWLGSLYNAGRLVLLSPLTFLSRPEDWLWAIHHHGGTVTAAPNFAFELCLRRLASAPAAFAGLDLSRWRIAANGAEPVSPETVERFCAAFAPYGFRPQAMLPVYGLAENSVGLAVPPLDRGARIDRVQREALAGHGLAAPAPADDARALRFVGYGQVLPGHELRVADEADNELPERRVGRLQFRGPSATTGYFNNPAENHQLFHGDWLDSGDLAYLADDEVFITSRVKDLIIRGGRNLYPYELEQAIGSLTGIRRGCVAVFGAFVPESGTERLVAVAETRETDPAKRQDLERQIRHLAVDLLETPLDDLLLARPGTILKTSSGKLRRTAIRDLYLQGGLGGPPLPPWRQLVALAAEGSAAWLGRRGRRLAELAYGSWFWGLLGLLLLLFWPLVAGLQLPRLSWFLGHRGARLFLRLVGLWPQLIGADHLPGSGRWVLAANHASYLDGLVVLALLPRPAVFVAKRELAGQRIAGPLLRGLGAVFVERFDAERSVAEVASIAGGLAGGQGLVFFPEGTFTRQAGLRPFHLGAFVAAALNGAPVVPMAISGLRQVLRDESWLPRPCPITVTIGTPLLPGADSWEEALRLRDRARAHILRRCGEPDLESPSLH